MKTSQAGYKKIAENSNEGLDQRGVYYLQLLNNSALEVTATDNEIGAIPLLPGIPFELRGHPDYPFNVSFTFSFLQEGEINYITATYLKAYGNDKK